MRTTAVYPDHTVAPSVETIFVDGYKFDICEFAKEARKEFGVTDKSRFFLTLEDKLLPHKVPTVSAIKAFGEYHVWGQLICADKAFLKTFISDFEKDMETVEKWRERSERNTVWESRYQETISKFKSRWGVSL